MASTERRTSSTEARLEFCSTDEGAECGIGIRLEADAAHPTGQALCAKGRAAPELVSSAERLTHPLRRTRP